MNPTEQIVVVSEPSPDLNAYGYPEALKPSRFVEGQAVELHDVDVRPNMLGGVAETVTTRKGWLLEVPREHFNVPNGTWPYRTVHFFLSGKGRKFWVVPQGTDKDAAVTACAQSLGS